MVSHDGGDYLNWESRSWRLDDAGDYQEPALRETGFWRFVLDPDDPSESQAIELLLAHSAGYIELFYGRPRNQSSWELATDALARSRSGMLVGGAKRLYGIVEGGDLAYVEETGGRRRRAGATSVGAVVSLRRLKTGSSHLVIAR